jgi:hypothetical protein
MQRQQQTVQQHMASLSEQDHQKFNQLSFVENYHYLAQHNLLEHDAESESEFSVSDSESEDYLPDLCVPNAESEWTPFPHLDPDTKSELELSKISNKFEAQIMEKLLLSKSCHAKLICVSPKATNEVCNTYSHS